MKILNSIYFKFNIMITNKDKTKIAPIYIIKKIKAKNSNCKKNNKIELNINNKIKKNNECIGLYEEITKIAKNKIKQKKNI